MSFEALCMACETPYKHQPCSECGLRVCYNRACMRWDLCLCSFDGETELPALELADEYWAAGWRPA